MIRRLEIENFYSIRQTQVIDLTINAGVPDEDGRFGKLRDGSGFRVPRTVSIFGANASGKSNALRALSFLRWFLVDSFETPPDAPLPILRFADGNQAPARIKVYFESSANYEDRAPTNGPFAQYSYEVNIGPSPGRPNVVLFEELRQLPVKGKSRRIFVRNENGSVEGGTGLSLKGLSQILANLRPNVSATSMIAQFTGNVPIAGLLAWAKSISSNVAPGNYEKADKGAATKAYAENSLMRSHLQGVIAKLDFGIQGINLRETPEGIQPEFVHYGLSSPLRLNGESEGTRQFYCMLPTIWHAMEASRGGIAVVDEIDSTIHPAILPAVLQWFYAPTNMTGAQLWFSGHSISLLEELRKEEIFFTEKDGQGRTSIYGLKDIEGVRRVDNFYQKYLGGVYGAVPRIG
ncbi:MAG TPA: AAA family ATPase [Terracidiphilus sp.]|nr:AAA family ATPase [Terracidiphilus sp.]